MGKSTINYLLIEKKLTIKIFSFLLSLFILFFCCHSAVAAKKENSKENFIDSIREGRADEAKAFLDKGLSPNIVYYEDKPIMHLAIVRDHYDIVKLLIEYGANLDFLNEFKRRHIPITKFDNLVNNCGSEKIFILLIKNKADLVSSKTLYFSVKNYMHELTEYLLKNGANANVQIYDYKHKQCFTALIEAIKCRNEQAVDLLIQYKANMTLVDDKKEGRYPISYAIDSGNEKIIQKILNAGANVNLAFHHEYDYKMPPLIQLLKKGSSYHYDEIKFIKLFKLLLEKGVDLNIVFEGETPLTIAMRYSDVPRQVPLLFYQHGAKIKNYSEYNKLLIICSKTENSAGIMASLLDLKQSKDKNGVTLINSSDYKHLLYACSKTENSVDTMKLLLNLDPFKDRVSEEIITCLFFNAVGYGNVSMFHFLLDNGVALHSQTINDNFYNDFYKEDLYNFVKNKKNYEELSFLISRGVDANRLVNIINSDHDDKISIQGKHDSLEIAKTIIDGEIEIETKRQKSEDKKEIMRETADALKFIIFLILFLLPIIYLYFAFMKYANYVLLAYLVIISFFLLLGMVTGGIRGAAWILIICLGPIVSLLYEPSAVQIFTCFIINLIAAIYYFSRKEVSRKLSGIILTGYALSIFILLFVYYINIEPAHKLIDKNEKTIVYDKLPLTSSLKPGESELTKVVTNQNDSDLTQKPSSKFVSPVEGDIYFEPSTGIELIWVEGWCYNMGQTKSEKQYLIDQIGKEYYEKYLVAELPNHRICLQGFWMGKYEITNDQFRQFKPDHDSKSEKGIDLNKGNQPVVFVSWNDTKKFIKWLNAKTGQTFSLPTEAQWEYACKAGTETIRYWGNDESDACRYANVYDLTSKAQIDLTDKHHNCFDGYVGTAPVGWFKPNSFGLYDMLGNVAEWCEDGYDKDAYSKHSIRNHLIIADNDNEYRIFRGAGWLEGPAHIRSAMRNAMPANFTNGGTGFRLCLTKVN